MQGTNKALTNMPSYEPVTIHQTTKYGWLRPRTLFIPDRSVPSPFVLGASKSTQIPKPPSLAEEKNIWKAEIARIQMQDTADIEPQPTENKKTIDMALDALIACTGKGPKQSLFYACKVAVLLCGYMKSPVEQKGMLARAEKYYQQCLNSYSSVELGEIRKFGEVLKEMRDVENG